MRRIVVLLLVVGISMLVFVPSATAGERADAPQVEWSVAGSQATTGLALTTASVGAGLGMVAWSSRRFDALSLPGDLVYVPLLLGVTGVGGVLAVGGPLAAAGLVSNIGNRSKIERGYPFSTGAGAILGGFAGTFGSYLLVGQLELDSREQPWLWGMTAGLPVAAGVTAGMITGYHWRHHITQRRQKVGFQAPPAYNGSVMRTQALVATGVALGIFGTGIGLSLAFDDGPSAFGAAGAVLSTTVGVPVAVNVVGNSMKYPRQHLGAFVGSLLGAVLGPALLPDVSWAAGADSMIGFAAFVGGSVAGSVGGYHLQAASRHRDARRADTSIGQPFVAPFVSSGTDERGVTMGWQQQF